MNDLNKALDLLSYYVKLDQLHTRKGSYTGNQKPLADAAQSPEWRAAKVLLMKYGRSVPRSGVLMDG